MKKRIRLSESDLVELVKKVINEQMVQDEKIDNNNDGVLIYLEDADQETVQQTLEGLTDSVKFLSFRNCEYADFSEIDICSLPNLLFINLMGTENNFEENVDCEYSDLGQNMYEFEK